VADSTPTVFTRRTALFDSKLKNFNVTPHTLSFVPVSRAEIDDCLVIAQEFCNKQPESYVAITSAIVGATFALGGAYHFVHNAPDFNPFFCIPAVAFGTFIAAYGFSKCDSKPYAKMVIEQLNERKTEMMISSMKE
jgi:hypothetical protein